jgi:hypothetical protein
MQMEQSLVGKVLSSLAIMPMLRYHRQETWSVLGGSRAVDAGNTCPIIMIASAINSPQSATGVLNWSDE